MAKPRTPRKATPGVSYRAEAPIYELFISVRSTHTGTTISLSYHEWSFGDEPKNRRKWRLSHASEKKARGFPHLSNLALWAIRRSLSGGWEKVQ